MQKVIFFLGILSILFSYTTGIAAATTSISFDPATVTISPGSTAQVKVMMGEAPQGLAGYKLTVGFPSSVVKVTGASFPTWASSMNFKNSVSGGYLISAVDFNKQVQTGASNIELATITLTGVSAGSATLGISGIQMNDDNDTVITPSTGTLKVTVEGSAVNTTATPTPTTAATTTIHETPVPTLTTKVPTITTTPLATAASTTTTSTRTTVTATSTTAPVTSGTTAAMITTTVPSTTILPAATATAPSVVMVSPHLSGAPTCGFTANTFAGYVPMEVRFRDFSTGESIPISDWEWNFGDGGSSVARNPTYIFRTPGTYTVALTVTNGMGSTTSTRTGLIRVLGPGEAMPTITQAVTQKAAVIASTEPIHPLPVWTPPQKTAGPTTKAAPGIMTIITAAGIALAGYAAVRKNQDR